MKRILAFLDFSDVAADVLQNAIRLARALQLKLVLLHVSTPDADSEGGHLRTDVSRQAVAHEMRRNHRALAIMRKECTALGVATSALLVRGASSRGNAIPKMLREAARLNPVYIVMGTHGHGRLYEALLGSASSAVVRKAACPVVLIPAKSKSSRG